MTGKDPRKNRDVFHYLLGVEAEIRHGSIQGQAPKPKNTKRELEHRVEGIL